MEYIIFRHPVHTARTIASRALFRQVIIVADVRMFLSPGDWNELRLIRPWR